MAGSISVPPPHPRRRRRRRTLVRLTPLIDVVFILLVFFMLATSFVRPTAIEVTAPGAPSGASTLDGTLRVEIRADGLRLGGVPARPATVAERVAAQVAADAGTRVVVAAGAGVALQEVVTVLDLVRGAGAVDVTLVQGG